MQPAPSSTLPGIHVAVLEDDVDLREAILVPGLTDYGFHVTPAGTAAELYRHMLRQRFDMVVLDIGLPDEDGLSVVRHLRELSDLGIVMLTGNQARRDRIQALSDGADAYLSKPVDLEILAATLHNLSRRLSRQPQAVPSTIETASAHSWRLDADGWCLVTPQGISIALSVPERCLLIALFASLGEPVKREQLIAALTQDVYDFDPHRLDMLVHRLRRKLESRTQEVVPLLTARGSGYLFVTDKAH